MSKRKPIKLEWRRRTYPPQRITEWGPLEIKISKKKVGSVWGVWLWLSVRVYVPWGILAGHLPDDHKTIPAAKRAAVRICERLRDSIPKEEL